MPSMNSELVSLLGQGFSCIASIKFGPASSSGVPNGKYYFLTDVALSLFPDHQVK